MGGRNPVVVQSMTDTKTSEVGKTVAQVIQLVHAGSEIVRITVNDEAAAKAVPRIRASLDKKGYSRIPLVGDFHFNGHLLLEKYPECAANLDKYRINPGNSGKDENFEKFIEIAIVNKKSVRIGANAGSLEAKAVKTSKNIVDAIVNSALSSAVKAEKLGLPKNKIVLSVKMSDVQETVKAYEQLAAKSDYALHLGLTEAGAGEQGIISSTAALAILLQKGIGDTIRVSTTPTPTTPRSHEVYLAREILQALGLRTFHPKVISCPGCGRTSSKAFQSLAGKVRAHLMKKHPAATITVAVMGCIVNGPGESRSADIGISLPGNNEDPICPVYMGGKFHKSLKGKNIPQQFIKLLDEFIKKG